MRRRRHILAKSTKGDFRAGCKSSCARCSGLITPKSPTGGALSVLNADASIPGREAEREGVGSPGASCKPRPAQTAQDAPWDAGIVHRAS